MEQETQNQQTTPGVEAERPPVERLVMCIDCGPAIDAVKAFNLAVAPLVSARKEVPYYRRFEKKRYT